jgi:hypothetical protein
MYSGQLAAHWRWGMAVVRSLIQLPDGFAILQCGRWT